MSFYLIAAIRLLNSRVNSSNYSDGTPGYGVWSRSDCQCKYGLLVTLQYSTSIPRLFLLTPSYCPFSHRSFCPSASIQFDSRMAKASMLTFLLFSTFCGVHSTLWIMQALCNWSPNRNGLLFTLLRYPSVLSFRIQSYLTSFYHFPSIMVIPLSIPSDFFFTAFPV